ncbi:S41 family peptidase [Candidatus Saccharibacteria bacterium]|nr:S41 family peptidase [Candidatus Saccharibacteria bacterium]
MTRTQRHPDGPPPSPTQSGSTTNPAPIQTPLKKQTTITLPTLIFVSILVAVAGFVLGSRNPQLLASLNPSNSRQNTTLPSELEFGELNEVYGQLKNRYDGKLDANKLLEGAKKGMTEATGDPYTVYFTDEEAKEFLSDLEGKFSGIGAELGKKDEQLTIISTIDNAPAQKAGLLAGDIIAKVNGDDSISWSVEKAVSNIRGVKGTSVKLTIVRGSDVKEFTITRDDIVDPSLKSEIVGDNIGYMRLSRFSESDTVALAEKTAREFKDKNVRGIILDLRGNGGGYVEAARGLAGLWLDGKVVVEERQGSRVIEKVTTDGGRAILAGIPTVVLVDGGSASASEIIAGAFNDYGVAKLVGEKTYGKGSVQDIKNVPGGGQLKVTIAKWYTPKGKNINGEGIEPAEKVSADANTPAGSDPQKDRALQLLQQ